MSRPLVALLEALLFELDELDFLAPPFFADDFELAFREVFEAAFFEALEVFDAAFLALAFVFDFVDLPAFDAFDFLPLAFFSAI
ncbi:MAG TPA: hypothetical protein VF504_02010 [Solirubrobacterales bacterium]